MATRLKHIPILRICPYMEVALPQAVLLGHYTHIDEPHQSYMQTWTQLLI